MYDYLIGTVTEIKFNSIVLENNKIGYLIYVSNPFSYQEGNEYKIYVYQQTKLNGKKYQQIDIFYAGVGIIGIPLNEYELENAFQQSIKNIKTV